MNRTAVAYLHNEQFLSSRYDDHPWLFFAPAPREAKWSLLAGFGREDVGGGLSSPEDKERRLSLPIVGPVL